MNTNSTQQNQITQGVIWKQLLLFFYPIVIGTFFQQLYNTVDAIVVGRFVGTEALAAVGGSAGQIISFVLGFFTGLSAGATVTISQYFGAGDQKQLSKSLHCAYAFCILGGILITFAGIFITAPMLSLMKTPPEIMAASTHYLQIYFAGILPVFLYNMGSAILRALGDSRRPLYYLIICCFLNILLDLLLVVVIPMGITGAAIATVISQTISALFVTRALMRGEGGLKLELRRIRIDPKMFRSQIRIGLPGGIQSSMYNISNLIIQAAINSFGTATTAAAATFGKIDSIYWMLSSAFGIAITTFVGQNYGANRPDRVKKSILTCTAMNSFVAIAFSILLCVFQAPLFSIFTEDPDVVLIGAKMVALMAPFYIAFVPIEIFAGALRGMGNVVIPTIMTMCGVCLVRLFWLFAVVPRHQTIEMVFASYPITWTLTGILFCIYMFHYWKKYLKKQNS